MAPCPSHEVTKGLIVIPTGVMRSIAQWRNLDYARRRPLDSRSDPSYNIHMSADKTYYVYMMTNQSRTLYVGFTNNIRERVWQHKSGLVEGFTSRYNIDSLVYVESFSDASSGIAREKQLKRWRREKKLRLIKQENPDWRDLSDGWYE